MLIHVLIIFSVFILAAIFIFRLVFRRDLDSAVTSLKRLQEEAMLKEGHLKEALEQVKMEKVAQIEKGKKEAKNLIEAAEKEAEEMRSEAKKKAEQERVDILEHGRGEVEKLKRNFREEVKSDAVKLAVEMIGGTFAEKRKEHLHHQLIAEFLEELRGIDQDKFIVHTHKGVFISSLPLTDDEMRDLKSIFSDKTGSKIDFEAKIDPSIITGIIVKIGDFVVDGSLRGRLNKVMTSLRA